MNRADEERLMRYLDGESEPAEVSDIERFIETSQDARSFLSDLERSQKLLRDVMHERMHSADDVAARVMARLPSEPVLGSPRDREPRSGVWGPALGLALAAAASLIVHFRRPVVTPSDAHASASVASASAAPALPVEAPGPSANGSSESEEGAAIEAVDFGARGGSIFVVSSGPEETPVIWLMDEPLPTRHRMKPL